MVPGNGPVIHFPHPPAFLFKPSGGHYNTHKLLPLPSVLGSLFTRYSLGSVILPAVRISAWMNWHVQQTTDFADETWKDGCGMTWCGDMVTCGMWSGMGDGAGYVPWRNVRKYFIIFFFSFFFTLRDHNPLRSWGRSSRAATLVRNQSLATKQSQHGLTRVAINPST